MVDAGAGVPVVDGDAGRVDPPAGGTAVAVPLVRAPKRAFFFFARKKIMKKLLKKIIKATTKIS